MRKAYASGNWGGRRASIWRERLMVVCDGGPSAWGVLFYPVAGVFTHFEFNGSPPGE